MTNPNDVLPTDVAREFGAELYKLATGNDPPSFSGVDITLLQSLGRIAFKRALEIRVQVYFGSEDVR